MSKEKLDRNQQMYRDYKNGINMYDLALKYGMRQPTVFKIIKREQKKEGDK